MNDVTRQDSAVLYALSTIKWLFMINGTALIAVWFLIGTLIHEHAIPSGDSLTFATLLSSYSLFYLCGLIAGICASFFGYLAHVSSNCEFGSKTYIRHQGLSMMCGVGSMVGFVLGSMFCINAFSVL